jgi:hypothetical protein
MPTTRLGAEPDVEPTKPPAARRRVDNLVQRYILSITESMWAVNASNAEDRTSRCPHRRLSLRKVHPVNLRLLKGALAHKERT